MRAALQNCIGCMRDEIWSLVQRLNGLFSVHTYPNLVQSCVQFMPIQIAQTYGRSLDNRVWAKRTFGPLEMHPIWFGLI